MAHECACRRDVVLQLPELDARSQAHVRYAPGYARLRTTALSSQGQAPDLENGVPYTAVMLAEFLGWKEPILSVRHIWYATSDRQVVIRGISVGLVVRHAG